MKAFEESGEDKMSCEQIKLSVIVPVYNVEPYIRRCLDSILAQTYENLEIILVDDGSTDRSGEICDAYQAKDGRIQVIHKKNGGIVSARTAGVLCATGEYTTFADSDDWVEEKACEAMVNTLKRYRPDVLVLGYKKEFAGFTEEYRQKLGEGFYRKDAFWEAFNRCVREKPFFTQPVDMILWNKAIRTELCRKYQAGCMEELGDNGDDDGVVFPCLLELENIFISAECFYHYCVRKKSVSWEPVNDSYDSCLLLAGQLITACAGYGNRVGMDRNFLLYKLFYHLLLVVPDRFFDEDGCVLYPRMEAGSNIIVYGKGVFAGRLTEQIRRLRCCNIVDRIDRADVHRLDRIEERQYDYVIIAIFDSLIVSYTTELLKQHGVAPDKILCMEKEDLTWERLPQEVRSMMKEIWS